MALDPVTLPNSKIQSHHSTPQYILLTVTDESQLNELVWVDALGNLFLTMVHFDAGLGRQYHSTTIKTQKLSEKSLKCDRV